MGRENSAWHRAQARLVQDPQLASVLTLSILAGSYLVFISVVSWDIVSLHFAQFSPHVPSQTLLPPLHNTIPDLFTPTVSGTHVYNLLTI